MAISPLTRAFLRALSYPDIELGRYYKLIRWGHKLTVPNLMRPRYKLWRHDVRVGAHNVPVRIYRPYRKGRFPVLIFFHGGGWVTGTIDSYDRICRALAALTLRQVVSVDYRLAPEHRFPTAVEDCYSVVRELHMRASLLGAKAEEIAIAGDSAGGNLAAAVSLMARDRGEFKVNRQVLLYPACASDHTDTSPYPSVRENGRDFLLTSRRVHDYLMLYANDLADLDSPYLAPLNARDLSRQPRTLIITAEYDPLRDEGEAYGEALRAAGNQVYVHRIADQLHGFLSLGEHFEDVRHVYRLIDDFLSAR
jgi:acetyl esterase/lipase